LGKTVACYLLRLYICPKFTQSNKMDAKKIQELISAYGLFEALENRLSVVVVGGVARSTIYSAFARARSPRERLIVETARTLVAEHEQDIAEYFTAQPAAL